MRKLILFICCLTLLQSLTFTTQSQIERGGDVRVRYPNGQTYSVQLYQRSYALLIGNSEYTSWNDLPGVRQDMSEVKNALEKQGFTVVRFDSKDKPVFDQAALNLTREEFNRQIESFTNAYGQDENNRLLIYYAGHGYTALLPDKRKMGYLVMRDAPRMPPVEEVLQRPLSSQQLGAFRRASINMDEIETCAKNITARHALFVFDSCFAGTVLFRDGESRVPSYITAEVLTPVREFLTAGNELQTVLDDSPFRKAFVRGIEGAADASNSDNPKDGYILASELYVYIKQEVEKYSGGTQKPTFGKISKQELAQGDFVFTATSTPEASWKFKNFPVELNQSKPVELIKSKPVSFNTQGLNLSWYCQQRFGLTSVPVVKEGDAYSWRCLVKGSNQEENYFDMDLIDACKKHYGNDFGPMLSDPKDVRSWKCTEAFSFDYEKGTASGERRWLRKNADNWIEQLPDRSETCYRVIGEESVNGIKGTVVNRCDNSFEAFIPDIPRKGKWLMFRTNSSQSWHYLGAIK